MPNKNKAFTLIELIVVITILAILWTIWFLSFRWYNSNARDSVRKTDIASIWTSLEIFDIKTWFFPEPASGSLITYSWWLLAWTQWTFSENQFNQVWTLNKIPTDPLVWVEYTYSVTNMRNEYEIWTAFEWWISKIKNELLNKTYADSKIDWIARVYWSYNWIILPIKNGNSFYFVAVPTIINWNLTWDTIENILANKSLVTDWWHTIPSSYTWTKFNNDKQNNDFNPNINNISIFTWSINDLTSSWWLLAQILFNTQNAYSWTTIGLSSETIKWIINTNIDLLNPDQRTINLWRCLINKPLWIKWCSIEAILWIWTWTSWSWSSSTWSSSSWSCATEPIFSNTWTFNIWSPSITDQEWIYDETGSWSCSYTCTWGYTGSWCSIPWLTINFIDSLWDSVSSWSSMQCPSCN